MPHRSDPPELQRPASLPGDRPPTGLRVKDVTQPAARRPSSRRTFRLNHEPPVDRSSGARAPDGRTYTPASQRVLSRAPFSGYEAPLPPPSEPLEQLLSVPEPIEVVEAFGVFEPPEPPPPPSPPVPPEPRRFDERRDWGQPRAAIDRREFAEQQEAIERRARRDRRQRAEARDPVETWEAIERRESAERRALAERRESAERRELAQQRARAEARRLSELPELVDLREWHEPSDRVDPRGWRDAGSRTDAGVPRQAEAPRERAVEPPFGSFSEIGHPNSMTAPAMQAAPGLTELPPPRRPRPPQPMPDEAPMASLERTITGTGVQTARLDAAPPARSTRPPRTVEWAPWAGLGRYWEAQVAALVIAATAVLVAGDRVDAVAFGALFLATVAGLALSRIAEGPSVLLHTAAVLAISAVWIHADGTIADRWQLGLLAPAMLAVLPCYWLAMSEGPVAALAAVFLAVAALPTTPAERWAVLVVALIAAAHGVVRRAPAAKAVPPGEVPPKPR